MHMIPGLPVLGRPRTRIKKSVLLSSLFYWAFTFFSAFKCGYIAGYSAA